MVTNPSRQTQASKGNRTRSRIKSAVVWLVSSKGRRFSLQDICQKAEITHGGFYFHYDNKEDVLVEVSQDWMKSFKTAILAVPHDPDFYTEIYAMLLAYVSGFAYNVELARVVLAVDADHPEVQLVFAKYQYRWWARLEERFRQARMSMELATGEEQWMAHALTESIFGLCKDIYISQLPGLMNKGDGPERVAERAADLWYRAVLGSNPDPT